MLGLIYPDSAALAVKNCKKNKFHSSGQVELGGMALDFGQDL